MGFVRDTKDQNEFFLVIKSPKSNESLRIIVDDIDEIEHVNGTLKFYIHYQKRLKQSGAAASLLENFMGTSKTPNQSFKSYFKNKLNGQEYNEGAPEDQEEDDEPKEDCSELFESKFVKNIIEAFNTVLEIVEKQEQELNEWVSDEV